MKLKSKLKIKKGETLAESVVTIAIFGILLIGITDFMSSQINFAARLHHRDEIVNMAQKLMAGNADDGSGKKINIFEALRKQNKSFTAAESGLTTAVQNFEGIVSFDCIWSNDKYGSHFLVIKDGTEEMHFALP